MHIVLVIGRMLASYAFSLLGNCTTALWLCAWGCIIGAMFGLGSGRNKTLRTNTTLQTSTTM
ncbi:hypothetical protein L2735_04460 [Shewanella olleyana]|uniref:hypothetical protein n=1 Tax=Shewanella olleyana TaxID=135626 RepID=UPI00200D8EDC|nr:hypothetical protein [Shewanella olleyana]MCL1066059.1 hypothetical protein [Shewanella olleyana]